MPVKSDFHFNQNNLQDYLDCPRRFQFRHLERVAWPALESEPVLEQERHIQQGARFHELVYQHQSNIPEDCLEQTISDPEMESWWQSYLRSARIDLPVCRYPELTLLTNLDGYRLVARFDLLAVEPGQRVVIVDWKTARRRPYRSALEPRIQTHLYPFMAVAAGAGLNEQRPVLPNMVEMVYWFPLFPDQPEIFTYTQDQYQDDRAYLLDLINEITLHDGQPFEMAEDEKVCRYCVYRSLCERGTRAGNLAEWENEPDSDGSLNDFDFSLTTEISF